MKERLITIEEIIELSQREESHFYDNKAFAIKGNKIKLLGLGFVEKKEE